MLSVRVHAIFAWAFLYGLYVESVRCYSKNDYKITKSHIAFGVTFLTYAVNDLTISGVDTRKFSQIETRLFIEYSAESSVIGAN